MCRSLLADVFIAEDENNRVFRKVREKDIPQWLNWIPSALGFMATDNFDELPEPEKAKLQFEKIQDSATKFVLATTPPLLEQLRTRPITIATSYPQLAKGVLADLGYRLTDNMLVINGSVEAAQGVVDAIIDIVISGDSLRENGFVIVEDDLRRVSIGAVTLKANAV